MRSRDFVSVFFVFMGLLVTMSRSGKEEKMSRKNGKKLLIVIAVGAVVIKAVRDVIKTKKQEEALKTALDDFYEEELNWWDREHEEGEEL